MIVAMTGVTGLIGRNLLLEVVKQNYTKVSELEILILGRSSVTDSLHDRVMGILSDELESYIADSGLDIVELLGKLSGRIKCCDIKLGEENLSLSHDDYKMLSSKKIDFFFHVAALTDFREGAIVKKELEKTNFKGTAQILELLPKLKLSEFCYVSSAYVCGRASGIVTPDYIDTNQVFRNSYEKTKLEAELLVRRFCDSRGIRFRVFRPSTVCGRLMEQTIGATPKFDVFYAWAAFFLRYKEKTIGAGDLFGTPLDVGLRFYFSPSSGLNIVPVDFVAKFMYHATALNDNNQTYHLSSSEEVPHHLYTSIMLKTVNITGVENVHSRPTQLNQFENFYYKTVGKIFTPYIDQDPILFDVANTQEVCKKANISCPKIDEDSFFKIMQYAKEKKFGLAAI